MRREGSAASLARYVDPSDKAATGQADADRKAALQNAPIFKVSNVNDRNSAQEAINLLKKVDPMLRLGAQQALNKGKTALNPGATQKDEFEGYLKDNEKALFALEGYLGSAQTQRVALTTFQVLHQQTIAEFGRLDGKMRALLGSSLGSPDDKRSAERMGAEDAKALGAGVDLSKAFEDAKKRDPKLADDMKSLETQRQQMETETDGLSTDSNNVTNKFRGITNGLMRVSGAAAGQSSVELKSEFDDYKEKAEQKKAQVDVVVGAVTEAIKAIPEGPAAMGKAAAGEVGKGVWEQIVKPQLEKWNQGGDKLFGNFPNNLDSLAKTDDEKAAVRNLRAAQDGLATANRELKTSVEQLEQKVRKVLLAKQAYGDAMRKMGDRIDAMGLSPGNKHAFREVMGLDRGGRALHHPGGRDDPGGRAGADAVRAPRVGRRQREVLREGGARPDGGDQLRRRHARVDALRVRGHRHRGQGRASPSASRASARAASPSSSSTRRARRSRSSRRSTRPRASRTCRSTARPSPARTRREHRTRASTPPSG